MSVSSTNLGFPPVGKRGLSWGAPFLPPAREAQSALCLSPEHFQDITASLTTMSTPLMTNGKAVSLSLNRVYLFLCKSPCSKQHLCKQPTYLLKVTP